MLRQAQQTCSRLRAFPELVEGFQVLNLMALVHPPIYGLLRFCKTINQYFRQG